MKKLFAFILFTLVCSSSYSLALEEGSYKCTGYDPVKDAEYSGYATINKKKDYYVITYDYGDTIFDAIGLIHPEDDDFLSVTFKERTNKKRLAGTIGNIIYEIDNDVLKGEKLVMGKNKVAKEKCKKIER